MNESFIVEVLSYLPSNLCQEQIMLFDSALRKGLKDKLVLFDMDSREDLDNVTAVRKFLDAKKTEGCSGRTIHYYENIIKLVFHNLKKDYQRITTDDIRSFLSNYQNNCFCTNVTLDNFRRVISSFFSWLEAENYIAKNPTKRIKKIKTAKKVKEIYSDEMLETIKEHSGNRRNLAIIEFLYSTGVRVGELVKLNKNDVDFEKRECVVTGKGNKQRRVYFDSVTKMHLLDYLNSRKDTSDALFCTCFAPYTRLRISGVEIMLRKIGKETGIGKVHPHKFRRTLATKAIDKGMPIEQVQRLLGHSQIDTTLEYAMVDDGNVKISHHKYLE